MLRSCSCLTNNCKELVDDSSSGDTSTSRFCGDKGLVVELSGADSFGAKLIFVRHSTTATARTLVSA